MPKKFVEMPSDDGTAAARRRIAFWQFSYGSGRTLSDVARAAGLTTANSLYNFMNGAAASLSITTLERIIAAFPTADDRALLMPILNWQQHVSRVQPVRPVGDEQDGLKAQLLDISIAACAEAFLLQKYPFIQAAEQASLPLPRALLPENFGGLFLTRVGAIGMERAYPPGSLLLCRQLAGDPSLAGLVEGDRVLVSQPQRGGCEVLIREVRHVGPVQWLWPLSNHPERQAPLARLPGTSLSPRVDVTIHAVVLAAWVPAASPITT